MRVRVNDHRVPPPALVCSVIFHHAWSGIAPARVIVTVWALCYRILSADGRGVKGARIHARHTPLERRNQSFGTGRDRFCRLQPGRYRNGGRDGKLEIGRNRFRDGTRPAGFSGPEERASIHARPPPDRRARHARGRRYADGAHPSQRR